MPSLVVIIAAIHLLAAACCGHAAAGDVEMVVLDYPRTVSAWSRFYIHVKLTNAGRQPVIACMAESSGADADAPCIELAYVFPDHANAKVPPVLVDVARALPPGLVLRPGESRDRFVPIVTVPRRFATQPNIHLDLYLIRRTPTETHMSRVSLPTYIEGVPRRVWRNVGIVLLLIAVYVGAIAVVVWRSVRCVVGQR